MPFLAGQILTAHDLNNSKPILVYEASFTNQFTATTSFKTYLDEHDFDQAPSDGKLVVCFNGQAGFNANADEVEVRVVADNTTGQGDANSAGTANAPAGDFDAVSVSHSADYSENDDMGFTIIAKSDITTGDTYVRGRVTAWFVPTLSIA